MLEAGFLPFDLHPQTFGEGIAQVVVQAGEGVGRRVLEIHRWIVGHDRDDDLAFFLDAGRQIGGHGETARHDGREYSGDYEILHGRSLMRVVTPIGA
ncbi:hypothetical protein D3C72_2025310 [compost metagenome]